MSPNKIIEALTNHLGNTYVVVPVDEYAKLSSAKDERIRTLEAELKAAKGAVLAVTRCRYAGCQSPEEP